MPRLDECHPQIERALEKEGWRVNPIIEQLYAPDRAIFIDIQATRGQNGTEQEILLAEVKCFPEQSAVSRELYIALGQYIVYRAVLAELRNPAPLYLALPEAVYINLIDPTVARAIFDNRIKLVIVNLETETVIEWIE